MLDVDDNGEADTLTDGVVILRYLFGFSGNALIEDAIDPLGNRTDPEEIIAFLDSYSPTGRLAYPNAARFAPMMDSLGAPTLPASLSVPEPSTFAIAGLGLLGLVGWRRSRA